MSLKEFCIGQFTIVTVVIVLCLCAYVFSKLTGHGNLLGFIRLLDVRAEQSIPTYVSVINLLLTSILSLIIYSYERINKQYGAAYWLFLAILFSFLSVDESASIHENFGNVHAYLVRIDLISPIVSSHQWIPFGIFFVLIISIIFLPFIIKLPADTRYYFLIAACVFITGAIGFEIIGYLMLDVGVVESRTDTLYSIGQHVEEGLEMYGVAIFNCALYREILRRGIIIEIGGQEV